MRGPHILGALQSQHRLRGGSDYTISVRPGDFCAWRRVQSASDIGYVDLDQSTL
jgi:hypothetical protein